MTALEARLDSAGRYIRDLRIRLAIPPATGWRASLTTDRIGNAEVTVVRYAESPADALDLALKAAAEWIQAQKDIR